MSAAGFGPAASRWAASYNAARPTLVVEPEGAREALEEAVRRRYEGEHLDVLLFLPDRRAAVARVVATDVTAVHSDYDDRRFSLEAVARNKYPVKGQPMERLLPVDRVTLSAMRDLIKLSDRLLVRSQTEWRRVVFQLGLAVSNVELVETEDRTVPLVERAEADGSVVVWAPFVPLEKLTIVATALRELHRRVIFVCEGGSIPGWEAEIVALRDAASVLARASAVVAADDDDPAPARALARIGIALCVSTTSGAREFLTGVQVFRPWSRRSVLGAVYEALGAAPPRERARPTFSLPIRARELAHVIEAPRVSIVVRTYNRPLFLERALRSVEAQTYPNIETIVVNDAGADVSALVERFTGAHLITQAQNDYRRVTNTGMRAANGTYVARLDDDDAYFPDHIEGLVAALERTGLDFAYADAVVAYADAAQGEGCVEGYLVVEPYPVERGKMLVSNQLIAPMLRSLIRKATLERLGWFSEETYTFEDYELCLRLLNESDFVHVDRVTAIYTLFGDGSNLSEKRDQKRADAQRFIYALHAAGNRPRVLNARGRALELLAREGHIAIRRPPWRFSHPVALPGYPSRSRDATEVT